MVPAPARQQLSRLVIQLQPSPIQTPVTPEIEEIKTEMVLDVAATALVRGDVDKPTVDYHASRGVTLVMFVLYILDCE